MPDKPALPRLRFSRRDFLKLLVRFSLSIGSGIGAGSLYTALVEPSWVDVTQVQLKLRRLPLAFSGFRMAQISDLHFGGWLTLERLRPALDLLTAQAPDAVVITGDFVHGNLRQARRALESVGEAFRSLAQRFPTFAVMGNHDHWMDVAMVRRFLDQAQIRELRNEVFPFKKDGQRFYLCGVDDIWEKKYDLKTVTAKLSMRDCAVLLAHEPDFADRAAATGQFDLQISGHSHGGQVVIPFLGPPLLPWLARKYPLGLYRVGEMFQYTNRGLGMAALPIRFNCRPEITVFTLESA
jgi:uncharacterized protein